jgi:hypothetical protein
MTAKNQEMYLRRVLYKAGYQMHKSRKKRGPDNMGGYMIVDSQMFDTVVAGEHYELCLEDVLRLVEGRLRTKKYV